MINKFTFIREESFHGSKITYETPSESLDQILSEFGDFLRGCGFVINGYLDVVNDDYPESVCTSEYSVNDEMDYDHPEANFDYQESETLSTCPVCFIEKSLMKKHECFDEKCPKDTW
jgi:hypothetical protein